MINRHTKQNFNKPMVCKDCESCTIELGCLMDSCRKPETRPENKPCPDCKACCDSLKIERIKEGMTGREVADLLYRNFDKLSRTKANKAVERKVRHLLKGENDLFNSTMKNKFIQEVFYVWSKKDFNNTLESFEETTNSLHDHLLDYNNPHKVTKEQVGLGNVDNTSDLDKPVSTAQQEAIDQVKETVDNYTVNGYKISENPVLDKADVGLDQVDNTSDIDKPVSTAQQAAINYVELELLSAIDLNKSIVDNYTINGYKISENPVLTKEDVGLSNVDNTSDLDKPISNATQLALDDLQETITDYKNAIDDYTVNGYAIASNPVLNGQDILLNDYTKAASVVSIEATDSVNSAIGILEYRIESFENEVSENYQTKTDCEQAVADAVANLVDSAPETLDTLKELAEALGNDANFATTVSTLIGQKLDTATYETDKETFALKTEIPTNVSELNNDAEYVDAEYVAGQIDAVTVHLDSKLDKLVSGTNIKTINGESVLGEGDIVTPDTTYEIVTTSVDGLMSAEDKVKLDGISEYADVTTVIPITTTGTEIATINGTTIYAPVTETGDLDLSDYVTQTELTSTLVDYAKTTDIPDTSDMLTKTEAATTYQVIGDYLTSVPSEYITETELATELEDYAKISDIPTVPTNVSEFANDAGYITDSALSGYAKTEDIPTNTSELTNDSNFVVSTSVSNIEVVEELPESPDDNTLYLIVSEE